MVLVVAFAAKPCDIKRSVVIIMMGMEVFGRTTDNTWLAVEAARINCLIDRVPSGASFWGSCAPVSPRRIFFAILPKSMSGHGTQFSCTGERTSLSTPCVQLVNPCLVGGIANNTIEVNGGASVHAS